ncbi:MAG: DUF262 domain-containing protein [Acidimicrobiia bacterium]
MVSKRTPTTKDISLLQQLYKDGQLTLRPEFQRDSVWPVAAKAYLIDTILNDRPIPLFFFQRTRQPDTGRPAYAVVDGQQRLRAIFDFMDGRFRLSQSPGKSRFNKRWKDLTPDDKAQVQNYDLVIEEISGYTEDDIRDVFVRLNKYLVKLSPQELRHARETGTFKEFVEDVGRWPFWYDEKVFSAAQSKRMRPVEFAAEVAILLIEGPQDKKGAIDLYYEKYRDDFPDQDELETRLKKYLSWIRKALPDFKERRFRKPVDLYALLGALDRVSDAGESLSAISPAKAGRALRELEERLADEEAPDRDAARYRLAASRQTDNIVPRETRITVLERLLSRV